MFFPKTKASPSVGLSKEPMIFNKVVFPEPLGPTKPANSPLLNSRSMSFNAVNSPSPTLNRLVTLFIDIMVSAFIFNS